jgi:hypothetical protein
MRFLRCIERSSGAPGRSAGPTSWITAACGSDVNAKYPKISVKKPVHCSPKKAMRRLVRLCRVSHQGCLRMPTESVFIRKGNREKLRKAEEKTGLSLARLINLLVEEGYLDELLTKHRRGNLRSAF